LTYQQYHLKIKGCEQIPIGSVLTVTGRVKPSSDTGVFKQISLMDTGYTIMQPSVTSHTYWQSLIVRFSHRAQLWILSPVRQRVSYPEEALVESFVLGSAVVLPEAIEHSIKVMGIAHIIAVSGSHLTLLIGLLFIAVKTKNTLIDTSIILFFLVLYTTIVGWQAAVTRSLCMSVVMMVGKAVFHRQVSLARSLLVSCVVMFLMQPWVILNIGWQLSVLATAGICFIYPILTSFFLTSKAATAVINIDTSKKHVLLDIGERVRRMGKLSLEATLASVSALACIWPILINNFGTWSWGAILSSLLFWWLFPLVISSCFIGVIAIRTMTLLGVYPAIVQITSSLLLEWPVRTVTWLFSQLDYLEWMLITVKPVPIFACVIWYFCLVLFAVLSKRLFTEQCLRFSRDLQPLHSIQLGRAI
jgi:ComEC/Rec2-related protein